MCFLCFTLFTTTGLDEFVDLVREDLRQTCGCCYKQIDKGQGRVLFCSRCSQAMHARCIMPDLPSRTFMDGGFVCEDCIEAELEFGDGEGVLGESVVLEGLDAGAAAELWKGAMELEEQHIAPRSHDTYLGGVKAFNLFLKEGLHVSEAAVEQLWESVRARRGYDTGPSLDRFWRLMFMFVMWGRRKKWKMGTVRTYKDGVAAKLRDQGVKVAEDPTKHPRVKKALKGLERTLGESVDMALRQAEALDEELMGFIMEDLREGRMRNVKGDGPMGAFEVRQARIAVGSAWGGLLRRGELVGLELGRYETEEELVMWQLSGAGYRATKTDGMRKGQWASVARFVCGDDLGLLMDEHERELRALGLGDGAKFFRHVLNPRGGEWADDGEAFNKLFKRCVEQSVSRHGLKRPPVSAYSAHSTRRGAAQLLRDLGVPRDLVKIMGRWKSDAVDAYFSTVATKVVVKVAAFFNGVRTRFAGAKVEMEGGKP